MSTYHITLWVSSGKIGKDENKSVFKGKITTCKSFSRGDCNNIYQLRKLCNKVSSLLNKRRRKCIYAEMVAWKFFQNNESY